MGALMDLLLLVLLSLLPGVPGLPFYNGFYYSPSGRNLGNGHGEGPFNGVKLVVETPEETLFTHRGASVTLPCRYHYEPALASPRPVRIKWWKLSENGAPEQDVLVAIGQRRRSFGDYHGRAHLRQDGEREASLELQDLRPEDSGRYRCEVIDGLEDESGVVELELRGEALTSDGQYGAREGSIQTSVLYTHEHIHPQSSPGGGYCSCHHILQRRKHRDAHPCSPAGRVYYLKHPEKLTLTEAHEACLEDGARIAKVGQLFAAWKFRGLDRCDAGWLADGSVRYPVAHPRPNCGPPEPGVRSFGFPDPQSRSYGVYCYRQR
ncbi:hyaluronan and proteoglycan link protein 3 [Fukomys damarensis]|uniref:hyaluronan and proteoglycan link protein 3 n=1 Tax=Fukomys damarensis TaxID=885580 RepID=UPI001455355E|nr:hyaluronan and proteoglycan link protein 3 [Fukomys damarensis]